PMLALRTGAAAMTVTARTIGPARWRVSIGAPIESTQRRDPLALTAEINHAVERLIRLRGEDWFWVHNRWKTPKPKFLLATYKRGITLPGNFPAEKLKPFRILIRSTNWLGDAVMSAPAVRPIKRGRPDGHVSVPAQCQLAGCWK